MAAILINLVIIIIVLGAVYCLARYIIQQMGLPPVAMVILNVACALIALLWLLSIVGGYGGRVWVGPG